MPAQSKVTLRQTSCSFCFSIDAIDLIRRLMTVRASDRLTAEAALQHSWLDDPEVLIEARALMESQRRNSNGTQPPQPPSPVQNGDLTAAGRQL
jgi:hypothetical protein